MGTNADDSFKQALVHAGVVESGSFEQLYKGAGAGLGLASVSATHAVHLVLLKGTANEITVDVAPAFLVGYQLASRRRTASQVLGARRSPLRRRSPAAGPSPRGPAAPLRAVGQRRWIGWAGALESTSVGSRAVEHKTDGDSPRRAKRLSAIPITVGYRLHGER